MIAASDNVLRGGLMPKYIDMTELLSVLDFRVEPVPCLKPNPPSADVEVFQPDVPDFMVDQRVSGDATVALVGPAIVICSEGSFCLRGAPSHTTIATGSSSFITPDEASLKIQGRGSLFVSTTSVNR